MARHDRQKRRGLGRQRRYKLAGFLAVALCSAAILSACSGGDSAETEPESPTASAESTEAIEEPQSPADETTTADEPASGATTAEDPQPASAESVQCDPAYSTDGPWNTPIGDSPTYHPRSAGFVRRIEAPLTSDPTQFTYPVYVASDETPSQTVSLSGWFSTPSPDGATFGNTEFATVEVPIPPEAMPASGDDAQVIIVDETTGTEWGFFNFDPLGDGTYEAQNGYQYNVQWSGAAPVHPQGSGFVARGAGIPYLAGLVRPCEIEQERIEHAIAFSYDSPRDAFVEPATKSDGASSSHRDLPEGARLQLDPTISEDEVRGWGCEGPCLTVARALQEYGLIVVDNAGRSKLYFEYEGTAGWNGAVNSFTVSPIPVERLQVVAFDTPTLDR